MIRPDELFAIVGTIDPDVTVASTVSSDWADLSDFEYILAIYMTGTLGSSATVNGILQQATDGSGAGAKGFTPAKVITEMTTSDEQAILIARQTENDVAGGFSFVRAQLTVAVATSDVGLLLLGFNPPTYGPGSLFDLASVTEIVA